MSPLADIFAGGWIVSLFALIAVYTISRRWRLREKRHREELRDYIDLTAAMVVVIDIDGTIHDVNRRMCDVLGYRRNELLGLPWVERMVAPAERALSAERLASPDALETSAGPVRRTVLGNDGSEVVVEWEFAVRRDKGGNAVSYLVSGHDVTAIVAHADQLRELRELAQAVAATDDARTDVVEHALRITGAEWTVILEEGVVTAAAPSEPAEMDLATIVAMLGGGEGSMIIGNHWYEPIPVDGVVEAVLALGFDHDARDADADLVGLLAGEAAVALRRLRSVRNLEDAALKDPLTDIANRRAFDIELPRALARARRSGQPLALASMDLNDFKPLNDTEGHDAGDTVLRNSAAAWLTELRGTDLLARVGGDEFSVILPDCGPDHVPLVTRRLREACPHAGGAGVGIVIWDGVEPGADLMRRADEALYADKRAPRGRPIADPARLAAVKATGLLDGKPDEILDELARAARWLLDVPTVALSLISEEEQLVAASCGLGDGDVGGETRMPMAYSTCQHAITSGRPLVTSDARENDLLRDTPAVKELNVVAYAGLPLFSGDGLPIGTLCAVDAEPRVWTEEDLATLRQLAVRAEAELAKRSVSQRT